MAEVREFPRLRPSSPCVEVDGCLIIGSEESGGLATLDPVSSIVARSLDGRTPTNEIAADVAAALKLGVGHARAQVDQLVLALGTRGHLVGVSPKRRSPRLEYLPIPADSCLGRRMALGRCSLMQFEGTKPHFRAASTLPEVLAGLGRVLDGRAVLEPGFIETVTLRATVGRRASRTQQIFDAHGNLSYRGTSLDDAVDTFERTVVGRFDIAEGGVWVEGPVLVRDGSAVLLHPRLHECVVLDRSAEVAAAGCEIAHSLRNRIDGTRLVVPDNRVAGSPGTAYPIVAAMVPGPTAPPFVARQLLYLAARWNQEHFDQIAFLAQSLRIVAADNWGTADQWTEWIASAFDPGHDPGIER